MQFCRIDIKRIGSIMGKFCFITKKKIHPIEAMKIFECFYKKVFHIFHLPRNSTKGFAYLHIK